jgi:hypothetical protein
MCAAARKIVALVLTWVASISAGALFYRWVECPSAAGQMALCHRQNHGRPAG